MPERLNNPPDLCPAPEIMTSTAGFPNADLLAQRAWRLERVNGDVVASYLILYPDGRLGGWRSPHDFSWMTVGDSLILLDWFGKPGTTFDRVFLAPNGKMRLAGRCRTDDIDRVLVEIDPVSSVGRSGDDLVVLGGRGKSFRKGLVVLRANERSLHRTWKADVADNDRNWDLCVSWYGKEETFGPEVGGEYQVLQNQDRKFTAIHKLLHADSLLWDYDYFMFPDDDILASWLSINTLFEICREHALELAQPALKHGSFFGPLETLQRPHSLMRFTNFVEVMCPIFSKEALRRCIPSFEHPVMGWGLDTIWHSLLGGRATSTAIIDLVAIEHTRPVGMQYGNYDVSAEQRELARLYGVSFSFKEYGSLSLV